MEHYLGNRFQKEGNPFSLEELMEFQIHLLYFGSNWSPPCKKIAPHLLSLYKDLNFNMKILEIIYVSCDFTEFEFFEAVRDVPWVYVPFSELAVRDIITRHYEVIGIPTMLLISRNGELVSSNVLSDISQNSSEKCLEIWTKKLAEV